MQMSLNVIVRMPASGGFWSTRSPLMGRNIVWGSLLSMSGSTSWCLGSQRGSMAGWCLRWSWRQRRRWSGHMYWPWLWWRTRCRLCLLCLGEWRKDWCVVIVLSVRRRCLCSWASCKIGTGCGSSLFDDSGYGSAHGKLSRWRDIIDGTILPQEFTVATRRPWLGIGQTDTPQQLCQLCPIWAGDSRSGSICAPCHPLPTGTGEVCARSHSFSADLMCLLRSAVSRASMVSRHVPFGWYLPGRMGIRSLIGRPKTHWAGDNFVVWSGVLRYINMARWNVSVSSLPLASVLSIIIRFDVLTPTSALQLLCGKATEERRWCTPQLVRKVRVAAAVNSGPPSEDSSSSMPNVATTRRRQEMRPSAPPLARSTTDQLLYLSTTRR